MPPFVIGFLASVSVGAWVYNKSMRHTGGNVRSSLTAAVALGVVAFVITLTILSFVDSALGT